MQHWIFRMVMVFMACGIAWAQDQQWEATGYGVSRSDAVNQAKREALAQGIGQMLTSATETENFMIKRDVILTETMGHVKSFTVLKELQGPDGAWEVRIRALISQAGLSKDLAALKILMQSIGNPRVAVLISETNVDGTHANKVEMVLLDSLKAKGFKMVDANQVLRFRESSDGVKAIAGDPDAAVKLGAKLNAEVVIVGTAVAQLSDVSKIPALANSGMKSASATVSLKAFQVSSREILAAKSTSQPGMHVNANTAGNVALEKTVVQLLGPKGGFFEALVESWRKGVNDGVAYTLVLQGVSDFATVKSVKSALAGAVNQVEQRSYAKPILELELTRAGRAEDLAELLEGLKVQGKSIHIDGLNGTEIRATLK